MRKISAKIRREYFNPRLAGSLGGISGFLRNRKYKRKENVVKELNKLQEVYLHKNVRKNFLRKRIIVHFAGFQATCDLIDTSKYARQNNGIHFLLLILDSFTKFMWIYPLRSKSAKNVSAAFRQFFAENKAQFRYLHMDKGKEFINKEMTELLKQHNVTPILSYDVTKAAIAERGVKTIMSKISRYFTHTNQKKYIHILQYLVDSYNSSFHSAHSFRPKDIDFENEDQAWLNMYEKHYQQKEPKPKLKIGDLVITSKVKPLFQKGYTKTHNEERFVVQEVKKTLPPTYILKDLQGNTLQGSFYLAQIQKVDE